ncbi:uncharacterized protein LOC135580444 isoform X2 [Columba livia]|uniref:uncharacterized protein LOC135580444 isoform X2 n=1 Tax=Columba livia TaxID=8932 RepID=UPI0031BB1C0E
MLRISCVSGLLVLSSATCHEDLHRHSSSSSSLSLRAGAEGLLCLEKMRVTPAAVTAAAQTPWGPERGGRDGEDKADEPKVFVQWPSVSSSVGIFPEAKRTKT